MSLESAIESIKATAVAIESSYKEGELLKDEYDELINDLLDRRNIAESLAGYETKQNVEDIIRIVKTVLSHVPIP